MSSPGWDKVTFVVMEDLIWSLLLGVFPALDMVSPCSWPGSSCCQPPSLEAAPSQQPSCHLLDAISSRVQGELSTGRGAALHSLSWAWRERCRRWDAAWRGAFEPTPCEEQQGEEQGSVHGASAIGREGTATAVTRTELPTWCLPGLLRWKKSHLLGHLETESGVLAGGKALISCCSVGLLLDLQSKMLPDWKKCSNSSFAQEAMMVICILVRC